MIIFKVFKLRKLYKDFKANPTQATANEVTDMAKELAVLPFVIFGLFLVLFFILGFTNLVLGSVLVFKILFVLGVVVFVPCFIIVRFILGQIFKAVQDLSSRVM